MKKLLLMAGVAALGLFTNPAKADICYVDLAGQVMVNGQLQAGVNVQAIPCTDARLPSDWPSPAPNTISTLPDPNTGFNYHVAFLSQFGDGTFPGPAGTHTFLAGNGAWFTAADVQLQFSFSNCPPVTISCADVLKAYNANPAPLDPFMGIVSLNILCHQFNPGDTATPGFWANKNGQALIKSLNGGPTSTTLANWLASNFPYLFGANAGANNLTGKSNLGVATFATKVSKVDAQMLATALAVYVTDSDLAGSAGAAYGFNVSVTGTGDKTYYLTVNGSVIGLANNTAYAVLTLLRQANLQKQLGTFNSSAFNVIFTDINYSGNRP